MDLIVCIMSAGTVVFVFATSRARLSNCDVVTDTVALEGLGSICFFFARLTVAWAPCNEGRRLERS